MVMPYGGPSIKGKHDKEESRHIMFQLLSALDHMHQNKVIHRDLKINNIVILNQRPMIIDFGISSYNNSNTNNDMIVTIGWRSPELLMLKDIEHDIRVDVWSLGVIMFNILTDMYPFYSAIESYMLQEILSVIPDTTGWISRYNIPRPSISHTLLTSRMRFNGLDEDEIDMISYMLTLDHEIRPTPRQCLNHKYFSSITTPICIKDRISLSPYPFMSSMNRKYRKSVMDIIIDTCNHFKLPKHITMSAMVIMDMYDKHLSSNKNNDIFVTDMDMIIRSIVVLSSLIDMSNSLSDILKYDDPSEKILMDYVIRIYAACGYNICCSIPSDSCMESLVSGDILESII
jgi:serine/threonine protein kinase